MGLFSDSHSNKTSTNVVNETTVINQNTSGVGPENFEIDAQFDGVAGGVGTVTTGADATSIVGQASAKNVALGTGNLNGSVTLTDYGALENANVLTQSALDLVESSRSEMLDALDRIGQPILEAGRQADENILLQYRWPLAVVGVVVGYVLLKRRK